MTIKPDHIINAVLNATAHHPKGKQPCDQLQSFRYISLPNATEVGMDNFGASEKDIKRGLAWFRNYRQAQDNRQYPAVFLSEIERRGNGLFGDRPNVSVVFELSVMDVMQSDCPGGCKGCAGRSEIQVEQNAQDLLSYLMGYIGALQSGTIQINGKPVTGLFHRAVFFQSGIEASNDWGAIFRQQQGNVISTIPSVYFAQQNLYGASVRFTVDLGSCKNFTLPDVSGGVHVFNDAECC
jgi:hypothetical protein